MKRWTLFGCAAAMLLAAVMFVVLAPDVREASALPPPPGGPPQQTPTLEINTVWDEREWWLAMSWHHDDNIYGVKWRNYFQVKHTDTAARDIACADNIWGTELLTEDPYEVCDLSTVTYDDVPANTYASFYMDGAGVEQYTGDWSPPFSDWRLRNDSDANPVVYISGDNPNNILGLVGCDFEASHLDPPSYFEGVSLFPPQFARLQWSYDRYDAATVLNELSINTNPKIVILWWNYLTEQYTFADHSWNYLYDLSEQVITNGILTKSTGLKPITVDVPCLDYPHSIQYGEYRMGRHILAWQIETASGMEYMYAPTPNPTYVYWDDPT